jgi:hypothetical protein
VRGRPAIAVVVEGRYPALFAVPRAPAGWLPDIVARLQLRHRAIPIVFADSRKFAEEWTYRSLAAAAPAAAAGAPSSAASPLSRLLSHRRR